MLQYLSVCAPQVLQCVTKYLCHIEILTLLSLYNFISLFSVFSRHIVIPKSHKVKEYMQTQTQVNSVQCVVNLCKFSELFSILYFYLFEEKTKKRGNLTLLFEVNQKPIESSIKIQ